MTLQEKVTHLRNKGASVSHNPKTDVASVNLAPIVSTNFYHLEAIEKALSAISMKAELGMLDDADTLLVHLLQDANIL